MGALSLGVYQVIIREPGQLGIVAFTLHVKNLLSTFRKRVGAL